MRILFFSHYFPPEGNAPASRTYDHCLRWVKAGHDVTVVTCTPNHPQGVAYPDYRNRIWPQQETVSGIRVVRVWTYLAPNAGTLRRILNFVSYLISAFLAALLLRRPDVIVATSPQFFCGWAGVLTSWLKWRPLVLEIRDIWPESIEAVGAMKNRHILKLLEWLERRMYLAATRIVAVGSGYRDNILSKVPLEGRIDVITNGVDLDLFQPRASDPQMRAQWNLTDKFICSYIGTLGMAHGLEVVLEAAEQLQAQGRDDIAFCLVGDGAAREKLQAAARRKNVESLVHFAGRQSKETIPTVLASSDACLIHLKKCDLFSTVIPSKIFETMAMARPIIMGVLGEARDIVLQSEAGIEMTPGSAESLVAAVTQLADSPELRSRLARSARRHVADFYNRDLLAARMLQTLERVATGKTAAKDLASIANQPSQKKSTPGAIHGQASADPASRNRRAA